MTNYEKIRLEELYDFDSALDYNGYFGWIWAWW